MNDLSVRKFYGWFTVLGLLVGVSGRASVITGTSTASGRITSTNSSRRKSAAPRRRSNGRWRRQIPVQVRQILLPDLNRVDRCTTCHLAVEDPSYGGYPQPLAYHPLHEQHPFERFGCTICHRGQGRATTVADAHGHVAHWDQPMLPLQYIQASCGQCHQAADNPGRARNWRAASRCSRTAAAAAATSLAASAASSGRSSTRSAPAARRNG